MKSVNMQSTRNRGQIVEILICAMKATFGEEISASSALET